MRLIDWRKKTKPPTAQRGIAAACGTTIRTVSRWEQGVTVPEAKHQLIIQDLTDGKVTPNDWVNGQRPRHRGA